MRGTMDRDLMSAPGVNDFFRVESDFSGAALDAMLPHDSRAGAQKRYRTAEPRFVSEKAESVDDVIFEGDEVGLAVGYKLARGDAWVLTLNWADFKRAILSSSFSLKPSKSAFERESIPSAMGDKETGEERTFSWGLHKSILDHVMCIQFTDVAQVADAARNLEILRDRDDYDRSERIRVETRYSARPLQQNIIRVRSENDRQGSGTTAGGYELITSLVTGIMVLTRPIGTKGQHSTDLPTGFHKLSRVPQRVDTLPVCTNYGPAELQERTLSASSSLVHADNENQTHQAVSLHFLWIRPKYFSFEPFHRERAGLFFLECFSPHVMVIMNSWCYAFFGLTNAPASFHGPFDDRVSFHEFLDKFVHLCSLMDILVFSKSKEDHEEHLRTVSTDLTTAEKLYAKFSKSRILVEWIFRFYSDASKKGLDQDSSEGRRRNLGKLFRILISRPELAVDERWILWKRFDEDVPPSQATLLVECGLFQPLEIQFGNGMRLSMVFVTGLPRNSEERSTVSRLAFWKGFTMSLGNQAQFSTAFHPETDGRVRKCRAPICWDQVGERILEGPEMIEVTNEKVTVAREKLKEAQTRQKSYADRHRRALEFSGDCFLESYPYTWSHGVLVQGKLCPPFHRTLEILN
ncbi:hypothetical protein Tco_0593963 [Tanacetum coccineum]